MAKESFASYLLINGGNSNLGSKALDGESSAGVFSKTVDRNMGGEFGFVYLQQRFALRFGFEFLKPDRLEGTSASTSSGSAELYKVDSEVIGYIPKVGAEIHLLQFENQRVYLQGTVGLASVTLKNAYTDVTIAPTASHTVEAKGTGNLIQGGIGYEVYVFDKTTFATELNYRSLVIDNLKYSKSVTTFSGAKFDGQDYVGASGAQRTLDFTGYYISIGFRWWL
ncbi:MAG: hypothetical protein V4736_14120 [Bdellovibrionota bacterium]